MRRLARLAVLGAFLAGLGLPATLLQGAAWARMALTYARADGWRVAVAETFDGNHPCRLCLTLRSADTAPHSLSAAPSAPVVHACPSSAPQPTTAVAGWTLLVRPDAPRARARRVDTPPPEAALS